LGGLPLETEYNNVYVVGLEMRTNVLGQSLRVILQQIDN
jgi:hypothetical protein